MSAARGRLVSARRLVRRSRSDESGSALVEFALVVPLFALLLFGVIQFGLAFGGWASVRASVQNSARLIALDNPGPSDSTCPALTAAEDNNPGYTPDAAHLHTSTKYMFCEIAYEIGTPVGTNSSSASTIKIGLLYPPGGNGTVTVCASIPALSFTGFFPNMQLASTSQFPIEDPVPPNDPHGSIQSYNPYGLANCGS
jgi:Flp pilus assembly pilin Flp